MGFSSIEEGCLCISRWNIKPEKEGYVDGVGDIYGVGRLLDETPRLFKSKNLEYITSKQLAQARIKKGNHSSFFLDGSYVKEGDLVIPENLAGKTAIIILKNSLVLDNPSAAKKAHEEGHPYFIDTDVAMEIYEKAKKGDKNYFLLEEICDVPTSRFSEEGLTRFLFGSKADDYGILLSENDVDWASIKIPYESDVGWIPVESIKKAFANQLYIAGVVAGTDDSDGLIQEERLSLIIGGRGVKKSSDTRRAYRKVEAYTPTQISAQWEEMKLSSDLKDIKETFIKALKK